MKLITKAIEKVAQKQYPLGSDFEQTIVAKFFDPQGRFTWYLMNVDPKDPDYLWGIVKGDCVEMGSFSRSDLQGYKGPLGLGIERDLYFEPIKAKEVWDRLNKGEHL